jgi:hypothetical protein
MLANDLGLHGEFNALNFVLVLCFTPMISVGEAYGCLQTYYCIVCKGAIKGWLCKPFRSLIDKPIRSLDQSLLPHHSVIAAKALEGSSTPYFNPTIWRKHHNQRFPIYNFSNQLQELQSHISYSDLPVIMPDITDAVAGPIPKNFDAENADNFEDVRSRPTVEVPMLK